MVMAVMLYELSAEDTSSLGPALEEGGGSGDRLRGDGASRYPLVEEGIRSAPASHFPWLPRGASPQPGHLAAGNPARVEGGGGQARPGQ
jgi:hypothetical protein